MTAWLSLIWMFIIIALVCWMLANILALLFQQRIDCNELQRARQQLWFTASLPWMMPLLAVCALALLCLAKYFSWIDDHCTVHLQDHPHFCFEHLPQFILGASESITAIFAILTFAYVTIFKLSSQIHQHEKAGLLRRLIAGKRKVRLLKNNQPLAFTVGIRQPIIVLSDGIKQCLSRRQQRIVVAHEIAHVRNKDVLKNALFEFLLCLHIFRYSLRNKWHLNTETRIDEQVANRFQRWEIAEVLVKLQRYTTKHFKAENYPISITGADTQLRILRLLQTYSQTHRKNTSKKIDLVLIACVASLPIILIANHHAVETLLGLWVSL